MISHGRILRPWGRKCEEKQALSQVPSASWLSAFSIHPPPQAPEALMARFLSWSICILTGSIAFS